jgi:bifunctional UDP-N-acetylglucosamine pyrophosphorylase/glucosamine-1-phosphate N-acetyltransferase
MTLSVVILAAGQGTRMKSSLPKVLHPLGGRPLVEYSVATALAVAGRPPVLVIGHGGDQVRSALGDKCDYVVQAEQLGTAHAVLQTRDLLAPRGGRVLVCYADMPLIPADSLRALAQSTAVVAMLTFIGPEPRGFGRIVRNANGEAIAIVEEDQATPEQKAIRELNPGVYCFDADFLWRELPRLPVSPRGEYFLTDLIALAVKQGHPVDTVALVNPEDAIGINNRAHLAEAEAILRRRINQRWLESGVTMIDPSTVYIEPSVTLSPDTVLWPNVQLLGQTAIGSGCEVGPNTYVRDSVVGDRCTLTASFVEEAKLEDDVQVGPYAHLRKGAHLAKGVHLGNFGEVKESYLGPGVKMGHFSYVGNAHIGSNVNIGAGTITANYDGVRKNPTTIGDDVFIGSDTMLVAPVTVGDRSRTGAGSVVTKNIPPDSLAVGLPARVIRKFSKELP